MSRKKSVRAHLPDSASTVISYHGLCSDGGEDNERGLVDVSQHMAIIEHPAVLEYRSGTTRRGFVMEMNPKGSNLIKHGGMVREMCWSCLLAIIRA